MPPSNIALPLELVQIILEFAVSPLYGEGETGHLERQQTGLALSLASKTIQELVEPILYRRVTLRHLYQVTSFKNTLATSRAAFISKYTKALWIVCEEASLHIVEKFLEACGDLDHIVLHGEAAQIFQFLPQRLRPYRLRELTLIDPLGRPQLNYLELSRLHIISSTTTLCSTTMDIITPYIIASAGIPNICVEVIQEGSFETLISILGRLLEASKQRHIWLKIHKIPSSSALSDNSYVEVWWQLAFEIISYIDKDSLRSRIHLSLVDGEDSVRTTDPGPTTFMDTACRAIDYDALH